MSKCVLTKIVLAGIIVVTMLQCKKPYQPAVLNKADNYLVVDGYINTTAGGVSNIILSRTKSLTDTVINIPEHGATVTIQSNAGAGFSLSESGGNGNYTSSTLSLNATAQYKLLIKTNTGAQYQSDFISVKSTPPIDSINWVQNSKGVNVYANTHDVTNAARYYRWSYVQTWEYHSQLTSIWGVANGMAYAKNPGENVDTCYNVKQSTSILLANSAALSQDVISNAPLATFLQGDSTLQYRSSFLVTQYALTPSAYYYWQIIQKNSQQLGTLFDLQPSQLEGNLHSVSNPSEPVVGFISATNAQEKRIFINGKDLQGWPSPFTGSYNCSLVNVAVNQNNFLIIDYPDTSYAPYYYVTGGPLVMAKKTCLDCRLSGGVTNKPSFW